MADIYEASEKGDTEAVERFISQGVDVDQKDSDGYTPIHWAACYGHPDTVEFLLEKGAAIDVKNIDGYTPIHRAARSGYTGTVEFLLERGAAIDVKDSSGSNPIHWAAVWGNTDTVKFLLKRGAAIDVKDNNGNTPIHRAARNGKTDTVKFLLSVGADPYITNKEGETARDVDKTGLINRYHWSEKWENRMISSNSTDWISQGQITAAVALIKDDFLIRFIKKFSFMKQSLVEMFVTRNPEDISNLLAFIGRNITRDGEVKIDQNLEKLVGEEGENRFYLVKIGILDNKSLLQFIIENGARMMKQREELLTLLAEKIEIEGGDIRIIKNLKLGLPSSIGLTECIKMTEEKFKWSGIKAKGMIFGSFCSNLLSLVLYSFDVHTDKEFVEEMFKNSYTDFEDLQGKCSLKFWNAIDFGNKSCYGETRNITTCFSMLNTSSLIARTCRQIGSRFEEPHMFTQNAIYAVTHCILPIILMFLVWIFNSPRSIQKIPFPPITRTVKFILETKKFTARSKDKFEKKMQRREDEISKNEDIVNLSSSIEAAAEASPQFFFQTVYFLPVLVINIIQSQNWEELVSYKMLSIVFSFISVAVSNHFIRNRDKKNALGGAGAVLLLVRVTLSCISRILIFSSWMFVRFEGNFHPTATISAFYITFLLMVIFNMILNRSQPADMLSFNYWIDIVLNSYSIVLHYNHFDYRAMLEEKKKAVKKSHESTLIRQIVYFLIFFILFLRTREEMNIKDVYGNPHNFTKNHLDVMIGVGWACFIVSWMINIAYYKFHPSAVEMFSFSDKKILWVFGRDVFGCDQNITQSPAEIEAGQLQSHPTGTRAENSVDIDYDEGEKETPKVEYETEIETTEVTDEMEKENQDEKDIARVKEEAEREIAKFKEEAAKMEAELEKLRLEIKLNN